MGLCTGFGGSSTLVNLIGYTKALDFLVSGRKLNPEEGKQLGYFDAAVSSANPLAECEEWLVRRLASTSPEVLRTIKAVLRHGANRPGKFLQIAERLEHFFLIREYIGFSAIKSVWFWEMCSNLFCFLY